MVIAAAGAGVLAVAVATMVTAAVAVAATVEIAVGGSNTCLGGRGIGSSGVRH